MKNYSLKDLKIIYLHKKDEPKTVSKIPIPDPLSVDKTLYLRFVTLVKDRLLITKSDFNRIVEIEKQLDKIAFNMYRLNNDEIKVILGEYGYKDFRKRIN